MGMTYMAAAVSEQTLQTALAGGEDELFDLLENGTDLGKMWNAAQVVIAGSLEAQEPLITGSPVGDDLGYGPAHHASSADVQRVAATFEGITEADLKSRFDPKQMVEQMVYPQIWDENPDSLADEVASAAIQLIELYRTAAAAGDGVIAAIV